jgi:hypothetical protein
MSACKQAGKRMPEFAALPVERWPAAVQEHVVACPTCRRAPAVTRVIRGLMAVLADGQEPPPDFADDALRALPAGGIPAAVAADPWHPAWGLIPAFAALAAGLFFLYQPGPDATGTSLLPIDDLSASEQLVLGTAAPHPDNVLAALLDSGLP